MSLERLQKFLAHAGISSRRHAEELIAAGRVRVDGQLVTELGTKVESQLARVEVDGRRVLLAPLLYMLLHKPRGTVTTLSDPEGRPTVAALVVNCGQRVVPVGRLDFATSGVLLLTNDGDFQAKLQHPKGGAKKIYHAKVRGLVDEKGLERWRRSIEIDGRSTLPAKVELLEHEDDKTWLSIGLEEGRNRQIRRLGEQAGSDVLRLFRVEYAGLTVEGLRPGQWRHLTKEELVELKLRFGVPRKIPRSSPENPVFSRRRVDRAETKAPHRPARPDTKAPHRPARPETKSQRRPTSPGAKVPHRPARPETNAQRSPTRPEAKAQRRPTSPGAKAPHRPARPQTKAAHSPARRR